MFDSKSTPDLDHNDLEQCSEFYETV